MKKYWTIYCHTLISDGRRYIGLTQYTMMHRWNQHCAQAKYAKGSRSHFANAIRLYGKDAFTHEVLAMSWDLEGANAIEEQVIDQEGTRDPEIGFNFAKGGLHTPHPINNPWDRPEYREANLERSREAIARATLISQQLGTQSKPENRAKKSIAMKIKWQDKSWSEKVRTKWQEAWNNDDIKKLIMDGSDRGASHDRNKTHCPYGHEYSTINTLVSNGRRNCRTCRRTNQRNRRLVSKSNAFR